MSSLSTKNQQVCPYIQELMRLYIKSSQYIPRTELFACISTVLCIFYLKINLCVSIYSLLCLLSKNWYMYVSLPYI